MDYEELDEQISNLREVTTDASDGEASWKEVWRLIKEIGRNFKQVKYPSHNAKNEAWGKFQQIVDQVKEQQAEKRQEQEKYSYESSQHLDEIISRVSSLYIPGIGSDMIDTFLINPIAAVVEIASLGILSAELSDKKSQLKNCSDELRKIWNYFNSHKHEMLGRDKQAAFEKLREIQDELDNTWEAWKEAQDQLYESRRNAWREKAEANIEKLESRLSNLYGVLSRREAHLSELEEKRDSAYSDDFRERVEGWIDEEESRIEDIKRQIEEVENWLHEEKGKLYG